MLCEKFNVILIKHKNEYDVYIRDNKNSKKIKE